MKENFRVNSKRISIVEILKEFIGEFLNESLEEFLKQLQENSFLIITTEILGEIRERISKRI